MAVSFKNLNGGAKKSSVKYMKLNEGDNTFRILPDSVLPGYTYWVTGANGKDLPFESLQFDRENEKFDNTIPCPVSARKLKTSKGEDLRCQWSYKCQVINKQSGEVEVLQLKKGILQEIITVAQDMAIDPTCLETGTWLTVNKKKTGPLAFNVEYSLRQLKCKSTPLEEEYLEKVKRAKSISELFPKESYEEQTKRLDKHLSGVQEESENDQEGVDQEAISEL